MEMAGMVQEHKLRTDLEEWERYLTTEAENYLRVYAFFVEEGRIPTEADLLPEMR
jgi:hypothetical protein